MAILKRMADEVSGLLKIVMESGSGAVIFMRDLGFFVVWFKMEEG